MDKIKVSVRGQVNGEGAVPGLSIDDIFKRCATGFIKQDIIVPKKQEIGSFLTLGYDFFHEIEQTLDSDGKAVRDEVLPADFYRSDSYPASFADVIARLAAIQSNFTELMFGCKGTVTVTTFTDDTQEGKACTFEINKPEDIQQIRSHLEARRPAHSSTYTVTNTGPRPVYRF